MTGAGPGPAKYDRLAEDFSAREYSNLEFYMQRRVELTVGWGKRLRAGDSVLELCCGDGVLACRLASCGLRYRGLDFAPAMVERAADRMRTAKLDGSFTVASLDALPDLEPVDAVVAFARTFFHYSNDPGATLRHLRPLTTKKIIVDFDPRILPVKQAVSLLRGAGFRHVAWRPFLVPQTRKLPEWLLLAAASAERMPLLRGLPLRWKFHCVVKGES